MTSRNNYKYISPDLFETINLSELKKMSAKELLDLGQLEYPLYKSSDDETYSLISYERASKIIKSRIGQSNPEKSFFYASGRSSNEASFALDLFARSLGCNHINTCSNYCHEASGIALSASIGASDKSISYDDLKYSDLIFVIGANPTSNHPRFAKILRELRENSKNIIAINPSVEPELQKLTSHYCQPNIGGDLALFSGLSKYLIENENIDISSNCKNTSGFEEFIDYLDDLSWEIIELNSGLQYKEIQLIAELYLSSNRTVFTWGMGLTHHINGTDNIGSIINLAILRDMINGKGKGLLPLRWHDNAPQLPFMGFNSSTKKTIFESFENTYDIQLPKQKGKDTLSCMQSAEAGDIEFAFLLGGNLFSVNPDRDFSESALDNIAFKVMVSSTLNETHLFGIGKENLILPFRSPNDKQKVNGLKTEIEIIADIAAGSFKKTGIDFEQFGKHKDIIKALNELLPNLDIGENSDSSENTIADHSEGSIQTSHYRFNIPTQTKWKNDIASNSFNLSSVRSEGQFNTMIYDESDVFRKQTSRNVLYISAIDIEKLGLSNGSIVNVQSETGSLKEIKLAEYDIKPGNVMTYMPEANILIPQNHDDRSKTPSFKSVSVTITNH